MDIADPISRALAAIIHKREAGEYGISLTLYTPVMEEVFLSVLAYAGAVGGRRLLTINKRAGTILIKTRRGKSPETPATAV